MPEFDIPVRVIYRESVTVEADSLEDARAIVARPGFNYADALSFDHDTDPEIEIDEEALS